MKKLILLNAILLLVLFSIKFSHENLHEITRVFGKVSPLLGKRDTPPVEIAKSSPLEEVAIPEEIPREEAIVAVPKDETPIAYEALPEPTTQDSSEELASEGSFEEGPQEGFVFENSHEESSFQDVSEGSFEEGPQEGFAFEEDSLEPKPEKQFFNTPPIVTFQSATASMFEPRPNPNEQKKTGNGSFLAPKRIVLSHTEGHGAHEKPYRTNYSLAEIVFAPNAKPGSILPMIDFRGCRFDNSKYAISTGLVLRYIPKQENSFCELLGVNLYYDYAPDTPGFHQQMGAGVEILGKRLDFRANFYAPFGSDDGCGVCCSRTCVNGWLSTGFNAEIGYLAYQNQAKSFFLYTALGPYYVTACKCKERERGVMLRVFPQYKDFLGLNLKYSYDPLFKSIFQAEIVVSLPFYQISKSKPAPCGISLRQIFQRVERR